MPVVKTALALALAALHVSAHASLANPDEYATTTKPG